MGYVSLKRLGNLPGGGSIRLPSDTVEVALTDKGKALFQHDEKHFWKAQLCQRVLVAVTGICQTDETTCRVEYTCKCDGFSPIMDAVLPVSDLRRVNVREPQMKTVALRRYDDGWRVDRGR